MRGVSELFLKDRKGNPWRCSSRRLWPWTLLPINQGSVWLPGEVSIFWSLLSLECPEQNPYPGKWHQWTSSLQPMEFDADYVSELSAYVCASIFSTDWKMAANSVMMTTMIQITETIRWSVSFISGFKLYCFSTSLSLNSSCLKWDYWYLSCNIITGEKCM